MKKIILKAIFILILIILFIKIFSLKNMSNLKIADDFLFLKFFSNGVQASNYVQNREEYLRKNSENKQQKIYSFKIDYKNMNFQSINLSETIDEEKSLYKKIAPGTKGNFSILLDSNQNLKYKIEFNSINEKPRNLNFIALKNGQILGEKNKLEDLSELLTGYINKNEKINITIKWYWNFESEQNQENTDFQDTKDSENIKKYQFKVCALGEEIL